MNKLILSLIVLVGAYCIQIARMFHDNINWISSSPEFNSVKKLGFFFPNGETYTIRNFEYKTYLQYVFRIRIMGVISDWRDIRPAVTSSLAVIVGFWTVWWMGVIVLIALIFGDIIKSYHETYREW